MQMMRVEVASSTSLCGVPDEAGGDGSGQAGGGNSNKGRKLLHNASSKVAVVVEKMLLPLLDAPLRSHVVFDAVQDQAELDLIEEVDKLRPDVMADSQTFSRHLLTLYDRYRAYSQGYGAVSRV